MMKILFALLLPIMAIAADTKGGGGGQGVVCYNSDNTIQSVDLLDFYEGRMLEGYIIPEYLGDYKSIYAQITLAKAPWEPNYLGYGQTIGKNFKFLPKGTRLKPTNDAGDIVIPSSCRIEQIVNFQGQSRIFVVRDFWEKMTETNRAGLVLHEYLWFKARENGDQTSARTRRTVSRFFSENFYFEKPDFIDHPGNFTCLSNNKNNTTDTSTPGTGFIVTKIPGTDDCNLNFRWINRLPVETNQTATLRNCSGLMEDQPEYDKFMTLDIFSHPENVQSHVMSLHILYDRSVSPAKKSMNIQISNLEFPGYDEKDLNLFCYWTANQ